MHANLEQMVPADSQSLSFNPNASYLLVGGLGGLGRSIARWMVLRGAKSLIFISRSGMQKEEARTLVEELRAENLTASVYAGDVSDEMQLKGIIEQCALDLPPIRGVIQGAMVLQVCGIGTSPEPSL